MSEAREAYARHQHYLEQYYNGQVNRFLPYLRNVASMLREQLNDDMTDLNRTRLNARLNLIESLISQEFSGYIDDIKAEMFDFVEAEAEFAIGFFDEDDGVSITLPSPAQLVTAIEQTPYLGTTILNELDGFSDSQANRIRNLISTGFAEGRTTSEIIRDVIGTRNLNFRDGALNVTSRAAERMVRTSLSHVASQTKSQVYIDNIDLIPYYEWVSTLDGRTSNVCKGRDGMVYEVNKGPLPPAHPNCRSTTSPLLEDEVRKTKKGLVKDADEEGTRASASGQVDADLSYNEWLKRQSAEFQDDALGPSRAKLFREGGLSLDKFTNDKGRELTLDELKSKYPTAWKKADI